MNDHRATTPETAAAPAADSGSRRDFIKKGAAAATVFSTLGHSGVWAAGSDAPEKTEVKIGFIPLTDCASVVMASVLGFDKKYGVKITPSKEASWAGVRDKLINGDLHMSHVLDANLRVCSDRSPCHPQHGLCGSLMNSDSSSPQRTSPPASGSCATSPPTTCHTAPSWRSW